MPQDRLTKDQRREAAREAARVLREKQKRKDARNRIFLIGGTTVGILAIFLVVALVLINANKPAGPGPLNMASDGILIAGSDDGVKAVETDAIPEGGEPTPTDLESLDAPVLISTYIDYRCPFCNQFEQTNGAAVQQLVESGIAALEVHPISILDRVSAGSKYSTRAAAAAACVANYEPDSFLAVNTALFAAQPPEQTTGLTNDEIVDVVKGAGVDSSKVATCIKDQEFSSWVTAATDRALADPALRTADGSFGTPRIVVNGQIYAGSPSDANAFQAFIAEIYNQTGAGNPTPTPTPTTPAG
jgi:protein-disulfide isomerase